jgi:hypothetical protein
MYFKIIETAEGTELHVSNDRAEVERSEALSKRLGPNFKGNRSAMKKLVAQ